VPTTTTRQSCCGCRQEDCRFCSGCCLLSKVHGVGNRTCVVHAALAADQVKLGLQMARKTAYTLQLTGSCSALHSTCTCIALQKEFLSGQQRPAAKATRIGRKTGESTPSNRPPLPPKQVMPQLPKPEPPSSPDSSGGMLTTSACSGICMVMHLQLHGLHNWIRL